MVDINRKVFDKPTTHIGLLNIVNGSPERLLLTWDQKSRTWSLPTMGIEMEKPFMGNLLPGSSPLPLANIMLVAEYHRMDFSFAQEPRVIAIHSCTIEFHSPPDDRELRYLTREELETEFISLETEALLRILHEDDLF